MRYDLISLNIFNFYKLQDHFCAGPRLALEIQIFWLFL